jgi:hypothetical protein
MKHIKDFKLEDFKGLWKSKDATFSFIMDKKANLTLPDRQINGDFFVEYIFNSNSCTNCLKIEIGNEIFFIKQITDNGFFLSTKYVEILLTKIN